MNKQRISQTLTAQGHALIQATHPTTLMFTTESRLTATGDCIVAVAADKTLASLSGEFKDALKKPGAKLTITMQADNETEQIAAFGSPKLILMHPTDMVIRKSSFVCSRTLAAYANRAASDLSRRFVEKLKNPKQKVKITLTVES